MAPWAQLSFSLYLLHPIALKMGINWVGVAGWGLNGDACGCGCCSGCWLIPAAYLSLVLFERPARDWIAGWARTLSTR
jgi:peptidoglycan/LPS O-acetylase OafA/YrhL